MIDPLGRKTLFTFDKLDRLIQRTDPDPDGLAGPLEAPVTSFGYCGCGSLMSIVDPLGGVTNYEYDNRYRLAAVKLPSPSADENDSRRSIYKYTYDKLGNLVAETDPLGHSTRYEYDKLLYHPRKLIEADPSGDPWQVGPTTIRSRPRDFVRHCPQMP
jgi:YD repeat-containing protein